MFLLYGLFHHLLTIGSDSIVLGKGSSMQKKSRGTSSAPGIFLSCLSGCTCEPEPAIQRGNRGKQFL